MTHTLSFIDLFAGAGDSSDGFIRVGYMPVAYVELDKYACDVLRTRPISTDLEAIANYKSTNNTSTKK
jgi:site-specific DNA-cytosine methylase